MTATATLPTTIYDQLAEYIASLDPRKILQFNAAAELQARLDFLLDKQKNIRLTRKEKGELEHYLIVNRIVGLAKARARHHLGL